MKSGIYIVYGKKQTWRQFRPFDMEKNDFVVNLIHASTFTENEYEDLQEEVELMNKLNDDFVFEIREK